MKWSHHNLCSIIIVCGRRFFVVHFFPGYLAVFRVLLPRSILYSVFSLFSFRLFRLCCSKSVSPPKRGICSPQKGRQPTLRRFAIRAKGDKGTKANRDDAESKPTP